MVPTVLFKLSLLSLLSPTISTTPPQSPQPPSHISRKRCSSSFPCWPSASTFAAFNASISGRLITPHPAAYPCHAPDYDANACQVARENWTSSFWRTSQPGAHTALLWELGVDGECTINGTTTSSFNSDPITGPSSLSRCDAGLVPHYAVNATTTQHIQRAIEFAARHDVYLVVKNTGHDHLGRSSGAGAFAIWTHNLKGRTFHSAFVPVGAPAGTPGQHAVTLMAGEQWLDVYRDATKHHRIVVGGAARTVGAAGGYLTGGGHSPFAAEYGLAVDNVLEITIVDAAGAVRVLSEYSSPEYFWAVRGGGGCSWGVIVSVTYKTHPEPRDVQVGFVQVNATRTQAFGGLIQGVLRCLVEVTDSGYTGYAVVETCRSSWGTKGLNAESDSVAGGYLR